VATSTSTGAFVVSGGCGVGGNLYVGLNLNVAGSVTLPVGSVATTALQGTFLDNVNNQTGFAGNKTFTGIQTISNTTASSSTTTGSLVVAGGAGIAGNVYVGSKLNVAGIQTISSSTSSTSTSTGSLVVSGGVGIAGNVYVASNLCVGGTLNSLFSGFTYGRYSSVSGSFTGTGYNGIMSMNNYGTSQGLLTVCGGNGNHLIAFLYYNGTLPAQSVILAQSNLVLYNDTTDSGFQIQNPNGASNTTYWSYTVLGGA
jgi:hypothetical protein